MKKTPSLLLFVLLGSWVFPEAPAEALPECQPPGGPGTTYLCDPLESFASASTVVTGGTFLADGWRIDAFDDRLLFDLGAPMISGTLRFYVRGVSGASLGQPGTATAVHRHLMELWDDGGHNGGASYVIQMRTWGNSPTLVPDQWGELRFNEGTWGEAMVNPCNDAAQWQHEVIPGTWLGGWVKVEITFGNDEATIVIEEEGTPNTWTATLSYAACAPGTTVFRYLYLPWNIRTNLSAVIDSVPDSVYAGVSFVGTPATCIDPCDDGNPCTQGQYGTALFTHYCDNGVCTADPLPDGTACGEDGVCEDGQCVQPDEPDAGAPDSGPLDAGATDAAGSDAATLVDGAVDAGEAHESVTGGCGCGSSGAGGSGALLLLLLVLVGSAGRRDWTH